MFVDLLKRAWRFLIRVDVVTVLILLVLLLVALGSCFPQRPINLDQDPQHLELWESSLNARYGGLAQLLNSLGMFRFFNSSTFLIFLFIFVLSTLVCTLDRWRVVWRRAFHYDVICTEATYLSADHTFKLLAPLDFPTDTISDQLTRHGFRTRIEENDQAVHFRGDINRFSISGTLFTHVGILLLISGALLSAMLGWRTEITIGPGTPSSIPYTKSIELHYVDFVIQRYPDGTASDFEALVQVKEAGAETYSASVKLNQPLIVNGMSILLLGYSQVGESTLVSLLVVRDQGYLLVILAGLLLLLGMAVTFYFPHSCIYVRATPEGVISLAGRADRRAYTFGRQFKDLVCDLEGAGLRQAEGQVKSC
jgi:cytochrome c biogenesis protein